MFVKLGLVFLFLSTTHAYASDCPLPETARPCHCHYEANREGRFTVITCNGTDSFDLKATMKRIADTRIGFDRLVISNSKITTIEAATTSDLKFQQIWISAPNLEQIHWQAFNGTARNVRDFRMTKEMVKFKNASRPYYWLDMVRSFGSRLSYLQIRAPKINHLPKYLLSGYNYLRQVEFGYNLGSETRLIVENKAFAFLDKLEYLNLSDNRINYIPKSAFDFEGSYNGRVMEISLVNNDLNSTSFANKWIKCQPSWGSLIKPFNLNLSYNQITYLDKRAFHDFFLSSNQNLVTDLRGNPLNCSDCRNSWLARGTTPSNYFYYKYRAWNAICDGHKQKTGKTIQESNFDHCLPDYCDQNPELYAPCVCINVTQPVITCGGKTNINLPEVFTRISASNVSVLKQKKFYKLVIDNEFITELGADITKQVKFDEIEISAPSLKRIHTSAFSGTIDQVKLFNVTRICRSLISDLSPFNVFDLISSFKKAKTVEFRAPKVDYIPTGSINTIGNKEYFYKLRFGDGPVKIQERAFFNMSNYEITLDFTGNQMDHVLPEAFYFNSSRFINSIVIVFQNNKFNSSSFNNLWLNKINLPGIFNFAGNQIKYLDRLIFKPFLDKWFTDKGRHSVRHRIDSLADNPINCSDCRNAWIQREASEYNWRFYGSYCDGRNDKKKTIFESDFSHCLNNLCKEHPELFAPCKCNNDTEAGPVVSCSGNQPLDLPKVFEKVKSISRKDENVYKKLLIANKNLTQMQYDQTRYLWFDEIEIDAENLQMIGDRAFSTTQHQVKRFVVTENCRRLTGHWYYTFELLSSFFNAEEIRFLAPNFTIIPSNAFKHKFSIVFKYFALKTLHFGRVSLSSNESSRLSIANGSFYQLTNLTRLDLSLNRMNFIPKHAFLFKNASASRLVVSLAVNHLNSSSFANDSLSDIKRPASFNLTSNRIDYLDQRVFQPFLDLKGNEINDLSWNPVNCSDCRNQWLVLGKSEYEKRVKNAFCEGNANGKTIFDQKMDHCK